MTDLLEGRRPRTPPIYFLLPCLVEGFEEFYEPVALVYVAEETDMEVALNDLSDALSSFRSKLARFSSTLTRTALTSARSDSAGTQLVFRLDLETDKYNWGFYTMDGRRVILQLDKNLDDQIPFYIEKWRSKCLLTTPVNSTLFEQGLQDIHEELGMETPREFLYYPSPTAMWREFEVWKPKITRVLNEFWRYQIPLCDPSSMHRRWPPGSRRAAFNFAAKRYSPGPHSALRETENSNEESGTVILGTVHGKLWKRFDFDVPFNLSLVSTYACFDFEAPSEYLYEKADEEDPTNQMDYTEYCFLGPDQWLLRELACVDFCHRVLGINRNERLYSGLEAIVENGSFCGMFGRLCVVCERPSNIEIEDEIFKLIFPDGEEFSNREWRQK